MTETISTTPQDRRLGWKILATFVPLFIVGWIAGGVAGLIARQVGLALNLSEPVGHTLSYVSITAARLLLWIPATHLFLKRRLRDLTFRLYPRWWLDVLGGIGVTTLALAFVFVASQRLGWLVVDGWAWQTQSPDHWLGDVWVSVMINTLVAFGEEIMFRAYLLTGLNLAWGRGRGVVIMMLVFGIVHLPAYAEQGMQSGILVYALGMAAVFGALLGLVYLRTGALWFPIAIHFAWNFVESDVLNLPGDASNVNLIGAVTRLLGPFPATGLSLNSALVLDTLAFVLLCAGVGLWLNRRTGTARQKRDVAVMGA